MKIELSTPPENLKKIAKWCGIAGWFLLLYGFGGVASGSVVGLFIMCFAVWLLRQRKKARKTLTQQATAEAQRLAEEESQREKEARLAEWRARRDAWHQAQRKQTELLQQEYTVVGRTSTHVVGTSYENDDGSSRRYNLAMCYAGMPLELRPFDYFGDPAYAVFCDEGQIGNLPAETSRMISEYGDDLIVTGVISYMLTDDLDDAYSCRIDLTIHQHK